MSNPLITVIVPVYKTEQYLVRCVDSIRNQTYSNLEIILVDDGSPDQCGEMCDAIAAEDSRIRVVHKQNGGLSSARNAGLDCMMGEYVSFVDSDDWIGSNMIETLYQRMVSEGAQIACCGTAKTDGKKILSYFNNKLQEQFTITREEAMLELSQNNKVTNSACDKLYHAKLFDGLRMKLGVLYEDAQIQHYLLDRAQKVTYTAEPLYFYFQSPNSILRGTFSVRHYDCIEAHKERIRFFEKKYPDAVLAARAQYIEQCLYFIYQSDGNAQWDSLRPELIQTVKEPLSKEAIQHFPKRVRLKRAMLMVHEKLYVNVMKLYLSRKG